MSFSKTDKYSRIDKNSKESKKMEMCQIISHSDDDSLSSSSEEDDLKDLIETLDSYEMNTTCREQKRNQNKSGNQSSGPEEICEYASDDNSFYETANSASPSNRSSLQSSSPGTMKSSSTDSDLLRSEEIEDSSDETNSVSSLNYSSTESPNLPSLQRAFNTCLDQALNQVSSSAQGSSFCNCEEEEQDDVPSLRERCLVVGIPETTIDEGVTRMIPLKLSLNKNSSHSLPRQLFHQMSSSEKTSSASEEMRKISARNSISTVNASNKMLWDLESTNSLSSIDTASDSDEILQIKAKGHVPGAAVSKSPDLELKSFSLDLKSESSDESAEKEKRAFYVPPHQQGTTSTESTDSYSMKTQGESHSSSLSFNSEQEEERLVRKSDYEKVLECLNLESSDESVDSPESSLKRSESLASAVQRSVSCSFASKSFYDFYKKSYSQTETTSSLNLNTNTNTSEANTRIWKESKKHKVFNANSSHTEKKSSNLETASSLNINANTTLTDEIVGCRRDREQKSLMRTNNLQNNISYHTLDDALMHADLSSDEDNSLDASELLDLHDKKCIQRSDCDFNYADFDSKELDSVLCDGLENDPKHKPALPSVTSEAEKSKKFKHHSERPNLVDTIDKILRLGSDDVALNRLSTASKRGEPLQSIDGTVIDSELQPFAVDFTKPRSADEDTFYWVPCDFKDYLQVSDRPLVSDYFPKDSTSIQFCCVMVREFVHVHFYLRLHERCQPAYAKYNIVIWDKSRQPVAHFRSHSPIYFRSGQAHHVSTFSNQAMQELLAQEMLVVSCHVTSFAKWEKAGSENTPWYFSNGTVGRLKSKDDMMALYCNPEYADVTLESSDGQKFPAHRAVICRESQLLKQNVDSCSSRLVQLNVSGRLLKQMLYVFYTGELPAQEAMEKVCVALPRWQEICELLVAAERYQAERLGRKCQAWLGISLSQDNVCTVYALAVRLGLPSLTHACRSYITKHRDSVVKSAEWLTLKDSPAAVADLLLNTDIYDRRGGTQHLQLDTEGDLHCLSEFSIAPNNFEKKVTFKDILYEFGYTPNP